MDLTEIVERLQTEFPVEPLPQIDSLLTLLKQAELRKPTREEF